LGQKHCENRQISRRYPGTLLSDPGQNQKELKKKKIYRKWEERRALDILKT